MLTTKSKLHLAISGIIVISTTMLIGCAANAKNIEHMNTTEFKLDSCEESFEKVNFCSDKFISEYTKAIQSNNVNFNHQYVLHFIESEFGFSEVVAIDPATYHVIPLGVEIKPIGKVHFSIDSDSLCFSGDIAGYRQDNSYSKVCYSMQANPFNQNPSSSGMEFIQSETEF